MSEKFEVSPIDEEFVYLKSKEEKWKNFPHCALPKNLAENVIKSKDVKIRNDDVILCGFPRSGTTLMQEMIWLIVNDFDFEKAKSSITDRRFPLIETFAFIQEFYDGKVSTALNDLQSPRTLKTHLPVQLLPDGIWEEKPKIIHISRDPKDIAISMYYYSKNMMHLEVEKEKSLQDFLDDKSIFTPYREHCINYFTLPNYSNIMYLTYEHVIENIEETIQRVASFLERKVSNENMARLKDHLKFDSMKKNDACNNKSYMEKMNEINNVHNKTDGFIRKGKAGGYKEEMSEEFIEKFDKWMAEAIKIKKCFK